MRRHKNLKNSPTYFIKVFFFLLLALFVSAFCQDILFVSTSCPPHTTKHDRKTKAEIALDILFLWASFLLEYLLKGISTYSRSATTHSRAFCVEWGIPGTLLLCRSRSFQLSADFCSVCHYKMRNGWNSISMKRWNVSRKLAQICKIVKRNSIYLKL